MDSTTRNYRDVGPGLAGVDGRRGYNLKLDAAAGRSVGAFTRNFNSSSPDFIPSAHYYRDSYFPLLAINSQSVVSLARL